MEALKKESIRKMHNLDGQDWMCCRFHMDLMKNQESKDQNQENNFIVNKNTPTDLTENVKVTIHSNQLQTETETKTSESVQPLPGDAKQEPKSETDLPAPDLNNNSSSNVNQKDKDGNTPLHIAAIQKDESRVRELVQLGADLNIPNKKRETPLHKASSTKGKDNDPCLKIIKYMIDHGANVSKKDYMSKTFLHILIRDDPPLTPTQFHDIANYLITQGHSKLFNTAGFMSVTPFQFAVYRTEVEEATLDLLQNSGVDMDASDELGRSVLFWAVNGRRTPAFLERLIQLGADFKHRNYIQRSLLHQASNWDNLEALKFFLGKGLDVNDVDIEGDTPLHYVMRRGRAHALEMAKLLIESGAGVKLCNRNGDIPLTFLYDNEGMADKGEVVELIRRSE